MSKERVHGPYPHRNRFRIIVDRADGERDYHSYASRSEAETVAAEIRGAIESRSVSFAVQQFVQHLASRGLAFASYARTEAHLDRLLGLEVNGNRPLKWIARRGGALYGASAEGCAVDTHRNALAAGKAFGAYVVERGWLPENPFATVKGTGRRKRGKPQLRVDEARRLVDTCVREATPEATAVLCALVLGMRAGEIAGLHVRDVDDSARLVWVARSKTEAGRRCIAVPALLQPLLAALVTARVPRIGADAARQSHAEATAGLLFGDVTRYWIHWHVGAACKRAGVPVVPPHGLRGTHATLAKAAGASSEALCASLGHASPAITEAAYIDQDVAADARGRATMKVLTGGKAS